MRTRPKLKMPGAAFLLFVAVAAAVSLPVLISPSARVLGNIDHPGLHGELFHQSDFAANARDGDLLHCFRSKQIAWPDGQDLREFVGFSLHLFFYLPMLWIEDLIVSYNILVIFALALNGYCAYLLGRHLTGRFLPSVVCGIMFMLAPYAQLKLEMGFIQKVITWWIPLFLRDLLLFLDTGKRRHAFMAGLAWSLMLLTYAPYAWYAVWAGILLAGFNLLNRSFTPRFMIARGWPALVPAVASLLFLIISLPRAGGIPEMGGPAPLPPAVESAPNGSLDIAHLLRFHPYHEFMPGTDSLTLGVSLIGILLAVLAVIRRKRHALPLLAVAALFLIVAVGPYLHVGGRIIGRIPLPYYFFACHLPWGERLGFPIRALPFTEIALAALSALALTGSRRAGARSAGAAAGWTGLLPLLVLAVIPLERAVLLPELFPPRTTSSELSDELRWLKAHGGVVLHVPFNIKGDDVRHYIHITARTQTRMMNHYLNLRDDFPVPPLPNPSSAAMQNFISGLQRAGCDLILVHPRLVDSGIHPILMPPPDMHIEEYTTADTAVFREWCGEPVYSDAASFIAYRVPGRGDEPSIGDRPMPPEAGHEITEEELRACFEARGDLFRTDTQIRVHHFFVPVARDATSAERLMAEEEARRIHAEASESSESSFELADRLTRNDPAGRRWGDIGYIARGCLPEEFENALFSIDRIGETILMERGDGFHVFRLMDIRPGRDFSFNEARTAVRDTMTRERTHAASIHQPLIPPSSPGMVFIPGGELWMGSTEAEIDESYRMAERFAGRTMQVRREWFEDEEYRLVRVRPFYIDRNEVTMAEYRAFVEATGPGPLPDWALEIAPDDNMPAVGVNLDDARAYAEWKGKRLPTVEEWTWAACGRERRRFPWGNTEPDGTQCNYADACTRFAWNDLEHNDGFQGIAPVGSYAAGATPDGLMDMAGNVREWTSTAMLGVTDRLDGHIWTYAQRHLVPAEHRSEAEVMYCVRGGGWNNAADDMRCADERMLPPDTRDEALGFRCAMDAR